MCVCLCVFVSERVLYWLIGAELNRWVHVTRGVHNRRVNQADRVCRIFTVSVVTSSTPEYSKVRNFMTGAGFARDKDNEFINFLQSLIDS